MSRGKKSHHKPTIESKDPQRRTKVLIKKKSENIRVNQIYHMIIIIANKNPLGGQLRNALNTSCLSKALIMYLSGTS